MEQIGRYRIVKEIGRGAMGIVYLATDPTIGRSVAIKTVRLRDVDNSQQREKLRERLFREARSAGVLSHPNIVTIYDMAEEDGVAYIAMEYVDGPTLDELMCSGKPLESGKLFGILRQTANAVDYAHTKGIVHRDIKPANIMLGRDGNVKVTDFGIAKINAAADSFTMTGTLVGTPNYMSPEQVQGHEVTGRSDQFSLAVIAYEILTGERPFPGEQLSTVVYKIVAEEPVSPQKLNQSLGPAIDTVLRKGLAKKPASRYKTCAEFVGSLETSCAATKGWTPMLRGASLNASTMSAAAPAMVAAGGKIPNPPTLKKRGPKRADSSVPSGETAPIAEKEKRNESKILPVAAALLMVVGVFSLLTWHGNGPSAPAESPGEKRTPPLIEPAPPERPAESTPAEKADEKKAEAPVEDIGTKPAETSPNAPLNVEVAKSAKPSAMGAAAPIVEKTGAEKKAPVVIVAAPRQTPTFPRPAAKPQDLSVATNPPGASVTLDGNAASCTTPCALPAMPGLHSISIRLEEYQEERREIHVGNEAQDVPLISLHKSSGTLMITSIPPGATITINDKVQSQTTPAQINLTPGTYTVAVEKNGKRQVDKVEIRNGNTTFERIPLN